MIIILNSDSKKLKPLSILENDEEDENDEDYEKIHENIKKNKKYIDKNPNFCNYRDEEMEFFLKQSIKNKIKLFNLKRKQMK